MVVKSNRVKPIKQFSIDTKIRGNEELEKKVLLNFATNKSLDPKNMPKKEVNKSSPKR